MIPQHPANEYQRAADPRARSAAGRRAVSALVGDIISGAH